MTEQLELQKVSEGASKLTALKIQEWLVDYMSDLLEIESDEVDIETTFSRYGLESSAAAALTGDLGAWLGEDIEPNIIYDYPTIKAVSQHLSDNIK